MTDTVPARAIEWVAGVVPRSRSVRVLGRLAGATTSSLHAVDVDREGAAPLSLVLRRYTDARVRAAEPQYPRTEAAALRALQHAPGVIAPRLVAVDETGAVCDVPAVLMTRLRGRPTLTPRDAGAWVRGLAEALAAIHRLDGVALEGLYQRWHDPATAGPPRWSREPGAWERLIDASRHHEPAGGIVLLHRDYHPGNVLWDGDAVSGIVDWPNACRGVPALDVGHCRRDIVTTHGVEVAEAFLAAYARSSGRAADPLCDALTLLDHNEDDAGSIAAYHSYGRTDLTVDLMHARLDAYALLVASRL